MQISKINYRQSCKQPNSKPNLTIQLIIKVYNLEDAISLIKKGIIIKYKHFPYKRYKGKAKVT